MKTTRRLFSLTAAAALLVCGCDRNKTSGDSNGFGENPVVAKLGLPQDYFPTTVGTRWSYDIQIPDIEKNPPLNHTITVWPKGDGSGSMVETRGRYYLIDKSADGRIKLVLSVSGVAPKQGPLQYPQGFQIKVERDDLNMYREGTEIFWAISASEKYEVNQVLTFDPRNTPGSHNGGPWGSYGQENGYSMRIFFFGSEPMISMGLKDQNDDTLFVGPEESNSLQLLHFRRMVNGRNEPRADPNDHSADFLDAGYEEDMWFAKGLGLIRLVQRVKGRVTMTWQLEGAAVIGPSSNVTRRL